ncbi:hypothetical protein [Bacillus phage FI_KG-Lek]|nr:hypothetical protein [Bacillus phage FI_KG-Lek]
MKNGKRLTKREKMHLKSYSLNPDNWLVFKKADGEMHLVHRYTSTTRSNSKFISLGGNKMDQLTVASELRLLGEEK